MDKATIRTLANVIVVSLAVVAWSLVLWTGLYVSDNKLSD